MWTSLMSDNDMGRWVVMVVVVTVTMVVVVAMVVVVIVMLVVVVMVVAVVSAYSQLVYPSSQALCVCEFLFRVHVMQCMSVSTVWRCVMLWVG